MHGSKLQVRARGEVVALADPNRVAQIIRILIDNALTHTPDGTEVTVTAVRSQDAAELIVGDDAKKGIDPRAIETVSSTASTPATPRRARAWAWRSPTSWPCAWAAQLEVVSKRGYTAFTLSLRPSGRQRRQREPAGATA